MPLWRSSRCCWSVRSRGASCCCEESEAMRALWWAVAAAIGAGVHAGQAMPAALNADAAIKISQAAIGRTIADYTLTDTRGRTVRLSSYRGKPLLVNFVYSGCFEI